MGCEGVCREALLQAPRGAAAPGAGLRCAGVSRAEPRGAGFWLLGKEPGIMVLLGRASCLCPGDDGNLGA